MGCPISLTLGYLKGVLPDGVAAAWVAAVVVRAADLYIKRLLLLAAQQEREEEDEEGELHKYAGQPYGPSPFAKLHLLEALLLLFLLLHHCRKKSQHALEVESRHHGTQSALTASILFLLINGILTQTVTSVMLDGSAIRVESPGKQGSITCSASSSVSTCPAGARVSSPCAPALAYAEQLACVLIANLGDGGLRSKTSVDGTQVPTVAALSDSLLKSLLDAFPALYHSHACYAALLAQLQEEEGDTPLCQVGVCAPICLAQVSAR